MEAKMVKGFWVFVFLAGLVLILQSVAGASTVEFFVPQSGNGSDLMYPGTVYAQAVMLQILTDEAVTCRYSSNPSLSYQSMEGVFDMNLETVHKEVFSELVDGLYRYYIRCKNNAGVISPVSSVAFSVVTPLVGSITLSEESPLKAGRYEVSVSTSKLVSQTPSLSYEFDGKTFSVPLSGSGKSWDGTLIIEDDSGEHVGSFDFQARDVEGRVSQEVSGDSVFVVDTVAPREIREFEAISSKDRVELEWESEDDDVESYKIFRSESKGVTFTDFYREVDSVDYVDRNVDEGVTYYYRISAVDEAGNEGPLSFEVRTTALLDNTVVEDSGLDPALYGDVDAVISEIDFAAGQLRSIGLGGAGGTVEEIYRELDMDNILSSSTSEMANLKSEVARYKTQKLSEDELRRKLDAAMVKVQAARKRAPSNIKIVDERETSALFDDAAARDLLLRLKPDSDPDFVARTVESSRKHGDEYGFRIAMVAYNLEITYLDGRVEDMAFVKEQLFGDYAQDENVSVYVSIPPRIAGSVNEVKIRSPGYSVVKDDLVLSLDRTQKELIYTLSNHIPLDAIEGVESVMIYNVPEEVEKDSLLTGYFVALGDEGLGFGGIVGIVLVAGLFGYFVYLKFGAKRSDAVKRIEEDVFVGMKLLEQGDSEKAHGAYKELQKKYASLGKKEKKAAHKPLKLFYSKLRSHSGGSLTENG